MRKRSFYGEAKQRLPPIANSLIPSRLSYSARLVDCYNGYSSVSSIYAFGGLLFAKLDLGSYRCPYSSACIAGLCR